jgi:hypothetical protein
MAKSKKRDNRGSKSEVAKAKRALARNAPKKGKRKRAPGPTKFQKFLIREGDNAYNKVPDWKFAKDKVKTKR